jgi:tRNA (mo5U34)-methyltransferase
MTPEEIHDGIERLAPWFQRIELAPGLYTKEHSLYGEPADHPAGAWDGIKTLLPEDLTGRSVLDVGCNAGFYAVEAKRRNASRVLAVDAQKREVAQARFVRRALGLDIEVQRLSVYDLNPRTVGQFDVVLALGLIYHLKHLYLALENFFLVTRDLLVLETEILPPEHTPPSFAYEVGELKRTGHPIAFLANPPDVSEAVHNWFLPSPQAIAAMLGAVGFGEVCIHSVSGARATLTARAGTVAKGTPAGLRGRFRAALTLLSGPALCRPGIELRFVVQAENTGSLPWKPGGAGGEEVGVVRLGAHLCETETGEETWDYGLANIPRRIAPGDAIEIELTLRAPRLPGSYTLELDMVAERITWFEFHDSRILRLPLRVESFEGGAKGG